MLWFSACFLGLLTYHAWRTAADMKPDADSAGLRKLLWLACVCGTIGTISFVIAALI